MIRWILVNLVSGLFVCSAFAQDTPAPDTTPEPKAAPEPAAEQPDTTAAETSDIPATFEGRLAHGHSRYLATDYTGALDSYGKAKELEAGEPVVYYFIGCAEAKLERWDDAISSLKTAATIAGSKDVGLHAKALFMIAVVQERRGEWGAAKAAWTEYASYAKAHEDALTFVAVAEGRLAAIEKRMQLEKDYAIVKERANKTE
jgi:hypothetical protein